MANGLSEPAIVVRAMSAKYHLGQSFSVGAAPEAVRGRPIPAVALETEYNLQRV